jgi:hypothetical protein
MNAGQWTLRATVAMAALAALGCRNVDTFTTGADEHFEGTVVQGGFVRSGFEAGTKLCVSLDGNRLNDLPGTISSSDGRFKNAALRPIPQVFHDPISTFNFGEGRARNLMYVARGLTDDSVEATTVISLMESEQLEVRVFRGAPGDDRAPRPLFGVFLLQRERGQCSF